LTASLLSALSVTTAHASQVTSRFIRTTSSVASATTVTYNVSFNPATVTGTGADDIKGIVVEFCQNSPLVGATCTTASGITATPTTGNISVAHTGATGTPVSFAVDAASTSTGRLILTHATGLDVINAANPISFNFTATNPSAVGTYYARILTYNTTAGAIAYVSATPGTHLDDGGVALSTARQLTINARVQEQLEFCVGAIPSTVVSAGTAPANCSDAMFNGSTQTVDIGVVDSTTPSVSPVAAANGGNDKNGGVMIRTNANSGATISYFAQQASSGTNHLGSLRVTGASCNAGSVSTDQCIDSAGASQISFATGAAGEKFGMTAGKVLRPTGSTTTNLVRNTNYDGDGTATAVACVAGTIDSASCFAWVETGSNNPAETLATSSTVLDYEMLVLNFAARAAATTPTGSYTVVSTYIATSTF